MTGRRLGVFSAATCALAWCLPVGHISGELVGGRLWGWQAFMFALSPLFGNDIAGSPLLLTWMVASALSNLVLVVALGFVGWRPQSLSRGLAWTLAAATVANAGWFALPDARSDLRVGYYLWLAAFAFGAAAALLSVRRNSTQASFGAAAAERRLVPMAGLVRQVGGHGTTKRYARRALACRRAVRYVILY